MNQYVVTIYNQAAMHPTKDAVQAISVKAGKNIQIEDWRNFIKTCN